MTRNISIEDIDRFICEPVQPENVDTIKAFVLKQFERGETRPEWCFIIDEGPKYLARAICFTFPGWHPEYRISFVAFDEALELERRASFLHDVADRMGKQSGASTFTYEIRTSNEKYDATIGLLRQAGFSCSSSRLRYRLDVSSFDLLRELPPQLKERSFADVGKEKFIEAFQVITNSSFDTEDVLRNIQYGRVDAARHFFDMLCSRDSSLDRWRLYINPHNEFVGIVIPQLLGDSTSIGTVGYIGVETSMRAKGYGGLILRRAVSILAEAGVAEMVDECDSINRSAIKLLEDAGYKRQYEKELWKLVMA